jgi:hypothetical protein
MHLHILHCCSALLNCGHCLQTASRSAAREPEALGVDGCIKSHGLTSLVILFPSFNLSNNKKKARGFIP